MGAKDPHERYQSAGEVVAALHPWLPVAQWVTLGLHVEKVAAPRPAPAKPPQKKSGFFGRLLEKLWEK